MESKRLLSLDILRGLTIILMIIVNDPGSWSHVYAPFYMQNGMELPLQTMSFQAFLFIVGVSIVFSMNKQQERKKPLQNC